MGQALRDFAVHGRGDDLHVRTLSERSFEAAALAYAQDHPFAQVTQLHHLVVREVETGREHGFRIDLDTRQAAPSR